MMKTRMTRVRCRPVQKDSDQLAPGRLNLVLDRMVRPSKALQSPSLTPPGYETSERVLVGPGAGSTKSPGNTCSIIYAPRIQHTPKNLV